MMNLTLGNDNGDSDDNECIEERKSEQEDSDNDNDENSENNEQWPESQDNQEQNADRILAFEPINNSENSIDEEEVPPAPRLYN